MGKTPKNAGENIYLQIQDTAGHVVSVTLLQNSNLYNLNLFILLQNFILMIV